MDDTTGTPMICNFYQDQRKSVIDGRTVRLHLCDAPTGHIWIVEYESIQHELNTFLFNNDRDVAESKYDKILKGIIAGKM